MSHSNYERSNGHAPNKTLWFLCGPVATGAEIQNISIDSDPFVVGRGAGISLRLQFKTVSGNHASFSVQGDLLILQDLGSTNGTYVNGKRIDRPVVIGEEDLIHFAEAPFRVRCHSNSQPTTGTLLEDICDQALALVQFDRLMSERLVVPHFQAVVDFATSEDVGYEVLGRGRVFGLESVASMFGAAAQLNLEVELSQLLRWEGIRIGKSICEYPKLFVNTHPKELQSPGLVASLEAVREMASSTPIVLELHEAAITCVHSLSELAKRLADLDIELAYDDFGAGQARLAELATARPHYVKFDMCLIRSLDTADPNRLRMVRTLVTMVKDLGILSLAEGIETAAEADACKELGFELAQGYYFGYPAPTVTRSRVAGI
jgi:EAL domain-containing protein (putative c-di-GMP-specific phosphodiesterase class I)